MSSSGPWVAAAFFCERVLAEKDEVMSAIRIIDRVTLQRDLTVELPATAWPPQVEVTCFVALKLGDSPKFSHQVAIEGFYPSGKPLDPAKFEYTAVFTTPDSGFNLIANLGVKVRESGTYWFSVLIEGQLVTRMPLTLLLVDSTTQSAQP